MGNLYWENQDDPKGKLTWQGLDGQERGVQEPPGWGKARNNLLQTGIGTIPVAWRCCSRFSCASWRPLVFPLVSPRIRDGLNLPLGPNPRRQQELETALGPCQGAPNGIRDEH